MALEPYQQRLSPDQTAPLPFASAEAFGAGAFAGLERAGRTLEHLDQVNKALKRNEEVAAAGKAFAQYRIDTTAAVQDARDNADPAASGHVDRVKALLDEGQANVLADITDPAVRQDVETQLANYTATRTGDEIVWSAMRRVAKAGTDESDATDLASNEILTAPDLASATKAAGTALAAGHARVDAYANIPADLRERMHDEVDRSAQRSVLAVAIRSDPTTAKAALERGAFEKLDPKEIEQAYAAIGVEERRAAAAAEHQRALAASAAREQLATVNQKIENGVQVKDGELEQAAALAQSIGDTSTAYDLSAMRIRNGVSRATEGWLPTQYDARINALRGLGEKRTPQQDIELNHLEKIAPGRKAEFRDNPGGWAALNGNPPPQVDFAHPETVAARRQWQGRVSGATGLPTPFLQPQEVQTLRAMAAAGPKDRLDVINRLATIGGLDAVDAVKQVLPEDHLAQRLVLLRPGDRAAAMKGVDARKANPGLVDGQGGKDAMEAFNARLGDATALLGASDKVAAFDIARNLYADHAYQTGVQAFDANRFDPYIHRALGGTQDARGVWHGGLGGWAGKPVLLPQTMSQQQFDTVLSKMTWSADHAPHFAGDVPMTPADIRKLTPVLRPDGRYEFHGPNGQVATGKGGRGVWSIDIAAIGRAYLK